MMRMHVLMHVPFEGPGYIINWAEGHQITFTKFYQNDPLPNVDDFDFLVIMGGPMSVYDDIPWFQDEKSFIRDSIEAGKKVLGICLGAQLIADSLNSRVFPNRFKEIGWFDVHLAREALKSPFFSGFPEKITPFHWHGDTFEIPAGYKPIGWSEATKNQGFFSDNVMALQFHLEVTEESLAELIKNGASELIPDKYIQTDNLIDLRKINESNRYIHTLLDRFFLK